MILISAIASDMATYAPSQKSILIDAFSGVGGNTIAFAKSGRWEKIFAIEKDEDVMKCARHNAHVYGVADVIQFFQGDALEVLEQRLKKTAKNKKSVIFASPPWGGPDYRDVSVYDLKAMQPLNLTTLYSGFKRYTNDIALYLPRTSDLNQLAELGEDDDHFEVVHYTEWGASKVSKIRLWYINANELQAICFYSGILASPT